MPESPWLQGTSPAFRLVIATSWLAPGSWQERQGEAIRGAIGPGLDWMEYLRLVDRHRIPALSWAALKRVPGLEIPVFAMQELQKRSDACRMQALKHSMLLAGVLKSFDRAAIPVMPFKGPNLSTELYGDVGLRQSHDLDLAVDLADLHRAKVCLENVGWRMESPWIPMSPRQWKILMRNEYHIGFIHSQGAALLELHWRNRWDSTGAARGHWSRSTTSAWQGYVYQAMNPVDQVVYLCCHGAVHAWSRAKWLGDMARIHAEDRVDWEAVLSEARKAGQERALLACLLLLDQLYGLPLPGLRNNPWKDLPSLLTEAPLNALQTPQESPNVSVGTIRKWFQSSRYERLLLPSRSWRSNLFGLWYRPEDIKLFHLPDGLFWAYAPLRPILWLWRWMRHGIALRD